MNKQYFFTGLAIIASEVLAILAYFGFQSLKPINYSNLPGILAVAIIVVFNILGLVLMIIGAFKNEKYEYEY